uniref:Uncharacterized protein n=1 Tax=Trieres chinensis TaxID=1514140 RepID=A0A7S1Z8J9_TRICV|mmetsp:Transcript_19679/g.39892  ORF Transcript_19679/g.39892 Transcript_19679/m.39892 type:complete len:162 (+) Transcript_19679:157-642(+)|eukprot:CAMPEP_0183298522 /NCGR_PEP_ID=MMETSP0160_2-20130417/5510_1 /TAXON_ID=2839 ORGANISM="Odontella Sinensis, Strain Grunow 1884" /NCGR_SAMPLE_ID=MMETSP0160_2 /ASSEMBLY_ACC=CAM_ASM_000250 /LENGTH=161 /DNA_ID=CAMNT_0025460573 /DNA_START=90 /DNA_END=575 /DNA_ORIENTATION=+
MKSPVAVAVAVAALASPACGFSSFSGSRLQNSAVNGGSAQLSMEYIPSGMSKEQWQKMKEAEKNKNKGKNLGKVGITSFKSRSFMDWQKAGGKNLFPVDPTKVKDASEIPYMQRAGGVADDSDIKKGKAGGGGGIFGMFGKKKAPEPEPEPEPEKKNWWTL